MNKQTDLTKFLENIKERIEALSLERQVEILQVFVLNGITINENRTGIRFNLGYLYEKNRSVFDKMVELTEQLEKQEKKFNELEEEKNKITHDYFSSENDEIKMNSFENIK